jgi:transcriptional regulator with XRE-family HTH domain
MSDLLSPNQCRAGRALLDWTQAELASRAFLEHCTVSRFESGKPVHDITTHILRLTLEEGGIFFTETGVRCRRPDDPPPVRSLLPAEPKGGARGLAEPRLQIDKTLQIVADYRNGATSPNFTDEGVSRERIRQRRVSYERLTGDPVNRHSKSARARASGQGSD